MELNEIKMHSHKNYLIKIKFNETNESKRIKTKLIDTNKAY